ncbi:DUF3352 domain-containing protein [Crocosphaera chwakensis]|uniref:DUF3352 domain-containing protein n=1 Tax=Crocosphaera chwakensis CCY0110 TaxID=391612 RepID=A3IQD9_9CHRO|nr:DUF3352 domain-containing protein [Crocosphaera chwakensis]EAZ91214.1 hypothetical protein CY0110_11342 [Crocosphaera chwakensis CCY0110]
MKLRPFFVTLILGVIFLLSLAATSVYWILKPSPLPLLAGGVNKEPITAVFLPKQAPVMVSLLTNPDRLDGLGRFIASPEKRRRSHQEIRTIEKTLLAKTGLDYQSQIQPWLGEEITLAVTSLDYDHNPNNGIKPGYLLAVSTKDQQLANEFLQASYSTEAIAGTSDLVFESYKGVNLIAQENPNLKKNTPLSATAVVGNMVLFANDIQVLKESINNVQVPDLNLKNAPGYQKALNTINDPRIGIVYTNFPALSAWLANLPIPELPEITQTLTIAFSIKEEGLVAQTALIGVSGEVSRNPILSEPVEAFSYLPANTILTATGTNLNQLWQQIETGLDQDSPLQQLLNRSIGYLEEPLGVNLSKDVFPWVKGEFSLGLVPKAEGGEADWIFVAEKSPDVAIDEVLKQFDQWAENAGYTVGNVPLLDKTVTVWTELTATVNPNQKSLASLEAKVNGVYANVDDYIILATSIEALSEAISAEFPKLIETEEFQHVIEGLSPDNDGYFYINWQKSEPILTQKLPITRVVEFGVKPLLKNLRSLTLSSQGSQENIRRATIFFNVGVE